MPGFATGQQIQKKRQLGIFESVFALFVARVLALSLPFRLRPFHNPALHFHIPFGVDADTLIGWSSFPSDRATLFACVAAVLWLVSRRLGILAMAYTLLGLCVPAIYCGIHYPTDIIAGTLLGSGIGVSRNTLHTQLGSVFRKTGTSCQGELISLLMQIPDTKAPEASYDKASSEALHESNDNLGRSQS